jgi:hypothetical protein
VTTGTDLWKDFSLFEGGPLYSLGQRLGLSSRGPFVILGLAIAALTWIPLVALAALGNVLMSGPTIPFLQSVSTHARLLVTIPLMFVAEAMFSERVRQAIRMLGTRMVPTRQLPRFNRALRLALALRDTWILEASVVAFTLFLIWSDLRSGLPGAISTISTWRTTAEGQVTAAGRFYQVISLTVFQFLIWRWCARMLIWWLLVWRISRLDLQLIPTHPDQAGGLGVMGVVHVTLMPLLFGLSATLVGSFVEEIRYGGIDVRHFVRPLAWSVIAVTVAAIAPLLSFVQRLVSVKQVGLIEYSALAETYVRDFDEKWLRKAPPAESLLGSADVQSLADLSNSFGVIRSMRIVPIAPSQIILLAGAAALPALPLVLFVIPLDELILRGMRTVLNV